MKFKLINTKTNKETICEKVTIGGFDYYVSDEKIKELKPDDRYATIVENPRRIVFYTKHIQSKDVVVIATTNPNIDIPKVVDEIENIVKEYVQKLIDCKSVKEHERTWISAICHQAIIKSQKTHPFSLNDVKEIINLAREQYWDVDNRGFSSNAEGDWSFKYSTEDEIIQKYQETKVLKIFYE